MRGSPGRRGGGAGNRAERTTLHSRRSRRSRPTTTVTASHGRPRWSRPVTAVHGWPRPNVSDAGSLPRRYEPGAHQGAHAPSGHAPSQALSHGRADTCVITSRRRTHGGSRGRPSCKTRALSVESCECVGANVAAHAALHANDLAAIHAGTRATHALANVVSLVRAC